VFGIIKVYSAIDKFGKNGYKKVMLLWKFFVTNKKIVYRKEIVV